MCFPQKIPKLQALPTVPARDDDAVLMRQRREAERLAASGGTAGTVKTDLAPSDLVGRRRVLLGI